MGSRRFTAKHAGITLVCIIVAIVLLLYVGYINKWWGWASLELPPTDYIEQAKRISEEAKAGKPENNVHIGGEEIDYAPGEYGPVTSSGPAEKDFSSSVAAEEYKGNWHSRSWDGEIPPAGRWRIAHYTLEDEFQWVDGELIAIFNDKATDAQIVKAAKNISFSVEGVQDVGDSRKAALLYTYKELVDPLEAAGKLQKECGYVEKAFPNISEETLAATNDPLLTQQSYISASRFDKAWENGTSGKGTTIAVLDSGIDMVHIDLVANTNHDDAYDAIKREKLSNRKADVCGHGTVVSGIASAVANNNEGIAGCALNAEILPIRIADEAGHVSVYDAGEGIGHLLDLGDKPDVVNMSFGASADDWWAAVIDITHTALLQSRISTLTNNYGVVFVAAAGNDGEKGSPVSYPAKLDGVIGVGAVDEQKRKAYFSSANETVDICAVGMNIYSTVDDDSEFGDINYPYANRYLATLEDGSQITSPIQGTSFAAPQVSAAAAMLRAQHPDWTAKQIEERLESTAVDLGDAGRDDCFGYGLLDAAAACAKDQSTESGSGTGTGTGTSSGKSPALGGSLLGA